ncbi:MAG: NAD(P)H-hydrate dehydratase [Planctomycetaceae bacterium]|nr:NAD(P)H-hydrate dehydratase [Planctomycetaceae bacterium]
MNAAHEFRLPRRKHDAHKGDFGRVLIVAGSRGMSGAAVLAVGACLRSGAGLVTVACPASVAAQIAAANPAAMTWSLPETSGGRLSLSSIKFLERRLPTFDSVGIGPGLGRSAGVTAVVTWMFNQCPCPLVLDADALNAIAEAIPCDRLRIPRMPESSEHSQAIRVLTPHFGEYRRLKTGVSRSSLSRGVTESSDDHLETEWTQEPDEHLRKLAAQLGAWLILKGPRTRITDGGCLWANSTGNPGMATGGSGDCLTGIIAAGLAMESQVGLALRRACYVHGLAGDFAAEELGQHGMNAEDMLRYLPNAWKTLENEI